jgi:uncharacterized protein YukE
MSKPANLEGLPWPDGEPGPLRSAASRLRGLAGGFDGAGTRLSGAVPPAWGGVASTSYSSTLTRGQQAVGHIGDSLDTAADAYSRLADTIESAQDDVRRAAERLHDARAAARQARARADDARAEADRANMSALLSPATGGGVFDPLSAEATAAEGRAQAAEADAATAEGEAARVETWAHGEADRAVARVERADGNCAAALDGTGLTGGLGLGGGAIAAGAQAVWGFVYEVQFKPLNPWDSSYNTGESAAVVGGWGSGLLFGTSEWTSRYASENWMRTLPGYWTREPRWVAPYMRSTPSGGMTQVSGYMRRGIWAPAQEVPDAAARAQWASRAKVFGRAGTAAALVTAGVGQYFDDLDNPNLNGAERTGRIGMQTVTVGGASALGGWGGAAGGAAIGTMICPGVGTVVGGVIGGIAGGALAGGVVDKFNDGLVNLGGDIGDGVSDFVSNIDVPDIDMPDIDMPDIDVPDIDIDLPDVDLTPW